MFYGGDKSAMKTHFVFFLSHFTKSGSNPLSVVGGNLGNEVLRKWNEGTNWSHILLYRILQWSIEIERQSSLFFQSQSVKNFFTESVRKRRRDTYQIRKLSKKMHLITLIKCLKGHKSLRALCDGLETLIEWKFKSITYGRADLLTDGRTDMGRCWGGNL